MGPKVPVHLVALAALVTGCTGGGDLPTASPPSTATADSATSSTTEPPTSSAPPLSRSAAIREWEDRAREHFKESAAALEQVSQASAAEDEAGLRAGCQRLHDTNSIGLQQDLPTPDPRLTAEIQRMVDDMNVATHACLRFALGRNQIDADNYQKYLARAVEHLQRAKAILTAAKG